VTDIAPDINCPHCGRCITCPHTLFYATAASTRDERADDRSFLQRVEDRKRTQAPGAATTTSRSRPAAIAQPGKNPAYVAAAIRKELNQLAATTEGSRNATLAKVACAVFEFVKGGHAERAAAWGELERIAIAIGLEPSEIKATLNHQWKKVGPRDVPAPGMPVRVIDETVRRDIATSINVEVEPVPITGLDEAEAAELLPRRGTA
jgi:hypothetical protein